MVLKVGWKNVKQNDLRDDKKHDEPATANFWNVQTQANENEINWSSSWIIKFKSKPWYPAIIVEVPVRYYSMSLAEFRTYSKDHVD